MREDRHLGPVGPLVLVVLLAVAVLSAGWWMPSAAQTVTNLRDQAAIEQAVDTAPAASPDTDRVTAGLVDINTTLDAGEGAGTGIVLTPTGQVLTNNHVIEGSTSIDAVDIGNGHRYLADVVGYDRSHDIAVLQLRGASGLATAPLGSSATLKIGDAVTAVGNAGGQGGPPAQAPGRVTGLDQPVTAADDTGGTEQLAGLFEVQADVRPGDSGGAMVDTNGTVVGVTTAAAGSRRIRLAGGDGFAIPIEQGRGIVTQIVNGGGGPSIHRGPTAILGIEVADLVADVTGGEPGGVGVQGVGPGSSPDAAGLEPGDVITSLDGRAVSSQAALRDALGPHRPGDRAQLGWTDVLGAAHRGAVRLVAGPPA